MAISLSSVVKGQRLKPPKVTIYGVGGIGKTTFASMAPNPIFAFTEEGQGRLDVARFEPRENDPVLRSWNEILECMYSLYSEDHDYQSVVLDTMDFAEPLLWQHTAEKHNQKDIESFGFGKGYIYACDEARTLLEALERLRNDKGMAVIILAHAATKRYDAPDHEPYDRYKLRLNDRLGNLLHDWSDALLFANWKTHIVKDVQGSGKNKQEKARGVGTGERVMFTEERPAWWAKNRYGLPFEMPLSWAALQESIAAGVDTYPKTETEEKVA